MSLQPVEETQAEETQALSLAGIGVLAPGFANWTEAADVLSGRTAYRDRGMPPLERLHLTATEARRMSLSMRIALEVAEEALAGTAMPRQALAGVFACSGGNAEKLHNVLESLAENAVSPNQFAHMGHHAAAGSWSIVSGSAAPTTSIGTFDGSFAAGLLEAGCQAWQEQRPVLFVAHDVPPPAAFRRARPVTSTFAVAFALQTASAATPGRRLWLRITRNHDELRMTRSLEALRLNNPAARALPLLQLIARGEGGRVVLPYHDALRLSVRYLPC